MSDYHHALAKSYTVELTETYMRAQGWPRRPYIVADIRTGALLAFRETYQAAQAYIETRRTAQWHDAEYLYVDTAGETRCGTEGA